MNMKNWLYIVFLFTYPGFFLILKKPGWIIFTVSMNNFPFDIDEKTLANYSLSGHSIKFCQAKWQLTNKKLFHSKFFSIRIIRRIRKIT